MIAPVELTRDEVAAHAFTIAKAKTEEAFVEAFAAYVSDVVTRETDPYKKIARFVHGMVEGQQETYAELMRLRGSGVA